jgi:hypothetical protein
MNKRGFIALLSVILISAALLLVVTSSSIATYYLRANMLDEEFKEKGSWFAKACVEETKLKLLRDSSFAGDATTTIADGFCYISPISTQDTQKQFTVRSIYKNTYTNFAVVLDSRDASVVSITEVASF